MKYRELKSYKFQLFETVRIETGLQVVKDIAESFIGLSKTGLLTIFAGYAWDGATNAYNSQNVILPSLVHDALCQLMRKGALDISYLPQVHKVFYTLLLEKGTNPIRAWYMYQAVKLFGKKFAMPTNKKEEQEKILEIS